MSKVMKSMDGNTAAAYVSYAFTDVAAIYPITPSSNMAEQVDAWSALGKKNIFNQKVLVTEMQSEAGAAGAVHGSLAVGALTTTYTASQGLLLMIPNMYKIAGELLPGVFHVSARAVASHALSIFGDHSDVMACRQTGFAMLSSNSVQEIMHLGSTAHLAAIKSRVPFLHFFDGFRTSHEIQKIEVIDYEELEKLIDHNALKRFRDNSLNPEHPVTKGTAQNPDIFFQAREASNPYYTNVPKIVEEYMGKINEITGRNYQLFNYYGAEDAERVIIAMGSVCETIEETIDFLLEKGEKVGLIKVRLYRPFSIEHFIKSIPDTVKTIAVLDRTKEPGSLGEPLYQDVRTAYYDKVIRPVIVGGRYGLGSKDTTPAQIIAVYQNLKETAPKNHFTIGIEDDVTNTSLTVNESIDISKDNTISCKFWGFGSDGTVGANKNAVKIIGDHTDKYVQAYFSYDSKKSGGVTISNLRFSDRPIRSTYLVNKADFVACHKQSYINSFDMVSDIKKNGTFLLNCSWTIDELNEKLPWTVKKYIADNNISLYIIDAISIAKKIGLGGRINMIMQAAYFKLTYIIPLDDAVRYLKDAIEKSYGHKGEKIVNMNKLAVDKGIESVIKVDVPANWSNVYKESVEGNNYPEFINNVMFPMNKQQGDKLPVSAFKGREDGTFPSGTSKYEKRKIAEEVPSWMPENCIQCNQCSYVCPHAVIRPFLLDDNEVKNAPEKIKTMEAKGKGMEDYSFTMGVSVLDCTGCGNCINICPAKQKALEFKPVDEQESEIENWEYCINISKKPNPMDIYSVKGSQFEQPLLEFSGACGGCGETPYAKLVTQMFGDSMLIANATGCSSIWGGSAPSCVYTVNKEGKGPAWANSLFEDNAEYGYGMFLGISQIRDKIQSLCEEAIKKESNENIKSVLLNWIETKGDSEKSRDTSAKLIETLQDHKTSDKDLKVIYNEIIEKKDFLSKKSQWIFGGDGWAYDIGFGGLDHVIASGDDVNILVFDTEVYSNTGGQSSKASPTGSVAKFAAAGKGLKKKDLGLIAMTYGYVYVAQVSMGANYNQLVKALKEAESYKGPSVIIAYAPCINHGIKGGMKFAQDEMKKAVEAGYWHLYRYNPLLKEENKNPFILDSKEPTKDYIDFIKSEVRYSSLTRTFPEHADKLFEQSAKEAKEKYETYKKMSE